MCGLVYADAADETGDTRTVPVTLYGKQADGTITAMLVDSDGKLDTSGSGTSGTSYTTLTESGDLAIVSDNLSIDNNLSVGNDAVISGTTTSTFVGNITGDVTGDVSGSSGSCTGNAATATDATNATNVAVGYEASDTTCFPAFFESTSGFQRLSYTPDFIYNSSADALGCADLNLTDDLSVQDDILCYGTATINDIAVAEDITVTGNVKTDTLEVDTDIDVAGSVDIDNNLSVDTINVRSIAGAGSGTATIGNLDVTSDLTANSFWVTDIHFEDDIDFTGNMTVTGDIYSQVQTLSKSGSYTLSGSEMFGSITYLDADATITLSAVTDGAHGTVIVIGDHTVDLDVNASDKMILDGTVLDDGDEATGTGSGGDMAVFTYFSADGWVVQTNGWTDD